jgi:hypothetical protein
MNRSSNTLLGLPTFAWRLLMAAAILATFMLTRAPASECCPPAAAAPRVFLVSQPTTESWVFARSRYSHDPDTGARVAQYAMKPPVEPLDDPRDVISGYSRTRTVIRGADGSVDTHYRVHNFGNARGGMDAEWERFHDAWRGSTIAGGEGQLGYGPAYGPGFGGYPLAYPGYGYGYQPAYPYGANRGFVPPGAGYGPGHGRPDAGRLDPDGADGYRDERSRTPDRRFFNGGLPPYQDQDYTN